MWQLVIRAIKVNQFFSGKLVFIWLDLLVKIKYVSIYLHSNWHCERASEQSQMVDKSSVKTNGVNMISYNEFFTQKGCLDDGNSTKMHND